MRSVLVVGSLIVCLAGSAFADERLTQADLLQRLVDLERLATPPPVGERTAMFSSYDRASRIDENGEFVAWDANADWGRFLREEADGWQVMAEIQGSGALTRIWSANPHGQIRFILDGETVIETPFEDLFNGNLPPFVEPLCYENPNNGGKNCYFPIGFDQSCKVVIKGSRSYYQINYVSFPPGTQVETFKFDLSAATADALAEVQEAWNTGLSNAQLFGGRSVRSIAVQQDLRPGDTLREVLRGAGTIRALYVALTDRANPRTPYALHRCVLRILFDGQDQPSVEVPLVDFFGSGFNLRPYNSLVLGTDKRLRIPLPDRPVGEDRYMYCYFPMPFTNGATIEIENFGDDRRPLGLLLYLQVERDAPPRAALRLRARFRTEDPCQVLDYPILETTGRGRVVGCTLNIDCPRRAWWGEGDDKVWIDGEAFPSYFGTGSEDYLGDAWGLRPHIRALQGVTLQNAYGKNSAYRWHIPDCIDFQESLRFTIENWQHNRQWDTYYGTVVYWYGEPATPGLFKPLTLAELTPPGLRIPNAIEIEQHVQGNGWGNEVKEKYSRGVEYSGQRAVRIATGEPVEIVLPATEPRTVQLKLRVNPREPFEQIEVTATDGRLVGVVPYERVPSGIHDVGALRLQSGENRVTVRCTGSPVLDCWIAESVPKISAGCEAEDLVITAADGIATEIESATRAWSGGSQLVLDFKSKGQTATLALPEQGQESLPALTLLITRGPQGGRFQTLLDEQPVGTPSDCYSEQVEQVRVSLGAAPLGQGQHTLGFRALEANAEARGMRLGLDAILLAPARAAYAIECEGLPIISFENTEHTLQHLRDGYSGGAHLWVRPTAAGAWLEFEVPVAKPGKYRLSIVYTTSFDYGIVQTYVDGEQAGEPFDTFGNLEPGPIRPLGVYDLTGQTLRVKCEVTGKAEKSPGYYFGVDCIILEPVEG
ncbi:MAG: DUF2961 domain-containing protein [Planctomycetes bacterium]|nr:DUF2961 domain-containing protein [Planctomycetota bacterium]